MNIRKITSKIILSKRGKNNINPFIYLFLLLCVIASFSYSNIINLSQEDEVDYLKVVTTDNTLVVHFIDVGQADCMLLQQGNYSMIIDAGNDNDSTKVIEYIQKQGISKLDYVMGTHVHEDHIGSLDSVIDTYDVDKIFFPKQTSTTKTFENFLTSVKNKGMKIYSPNVGEVFKLGEATFEIMAPNSSSYDDANNYSIVIKLKYGDTSFLLAADSEIISEIEMLNAKLDLKADVLKLGHHASDSSTSQEFLDEVNPKYAVITVGKYNRYGFPKKSVMDRLKKANITIYRTDKHGTIVAISDGENITFE